MRKNIDRRQRQKSSWNERANLYDKCVTETNVCLHDFLVGEQDVLDKLLVGLVSEKKRIALVEIGSGTGRALLRYANPRQAGALLDNVSYFVGIDSAAGMCKISRSKLNAKNLPTQIKEKFIFVNLDARRLAEYFADGKVLYKKLEADIGSKNAGGKIEIDEYNQSTKIVCILLNTLGVISPEIRQQLVSNMLKSAGAAGIVVLSVFNADSFKHFAEPLYRSIEDLTGRFGRIAFDYEKHVFRTKSYFSHWFELIEIKRLLQDAGCTHYEIQPISGNLGGFFVICREQCTY